MAARRTGSGRLSLDTGEWQALKDEVVEEVRQETTREPEVISARPSDSADFVRAIAGDVYTTKQRECFTTGPVAQLKADLSAVKREVGTVITQVNDIQSELKTAREVKDLQDRTFNRRLTLIVGGFTMLGVMGNLINIVWTIAHRGH